MSLSIEAFTAQLADLTAQFKAGTIAEAAYAEALAELYGDYDAVGTLSANIANLLATKTALLNASRVVDPDGTVDLVSDLPGVAAEGASYVVRADGHLYIRVSGLWADTGLFTTGWLVVSSAITAKSGQQLLCDTSTAGFNVTLPALPSEGAQVALRDLAATWGDTGKALTVLRNGQTIGDVAENLTANLPGVELRLVFTGGTWRFSITVNQ